MVRVRIAPSPTGYPHIGTIYQALFNYAFAKKNKGKFIVRIEDTDRNRFVAGSEEIIFEYLDWFGLTEDESVRKRGDYGHYKQSERLNVYHQYVKELLDKGLAFFSYFPKEGAGIKKDYANKNKLKKEYKTNDEQPKTIEEMIKRGDWVVRMIIPENETVSFVDGIRGKISFESSDIAEQVLLKSDGFPTYHLAAVVDDHLMEISHIIRAEEWLSSTPKHVLLYKYFGWDMPEIYHTATLRNPDKSKLSKRHGHTDVTWFKKEGFLPDAILNFLALLGWSHPEEKEIFDLEEFISLFDLKDIRPVAPIFDLVKLRWMNQQYIQMKSDSVLKKLILDYSEKAGELSDDTLDKLIPLLKSRMETLADFEELTGFFFSQFENTSFTDEELGIAEKLRIEFSGIENWKHDKIFEGMKNLMNQYKLRMPVFYKLLTGCDRGLPLPDTLEIWGKENSLKRLANISKK